MRPSDTINSRSGTKSKHIARFQSLMPLESAFFFLQGVLEKGVSEKQRDTEQER